MRPCEAEEPSAALSFLPSINAAASACCTRAIPDADVEARPLAGARTIANHIAASKKLFGSIPLGKRHGLPLGLVEEPDVFRTDSRTIGLDDLPSNDLIGSVTNIVER